jgi:hypothetical protein
MRTALLFALVTLPIACANGGANEGFSGTGGGTHHTPPDTAGPATNDDGGYGAYDAGHDAAAVVDGAPTPGSDAGPPATGTPDGGAAVDAGATDAGGSVDVAVPDGPTVLGESCSSPIDISAGGTVSIDTCPLTDSITATCGTTAAATILRGIAPSSGSTYSITFPAGWVLVQVDSTCTPMLASCGSTGTWGVSGATPDGYWYFAIEPASGACGTATVTVDRVM